MGFIKKGIGKIKKVLKITGDKEKDDEEKKKFLKDMAENIVKKEKEELKND